MITITICYLGLSYYYTPGARSMLIKVKMGRPSVQGHRSVVKTESGRAQSTGDISPLACARPVIG